MSGKDLLIGLSEEQKKAVLHLDGPMMVIAGPGSGKTETMIRRTAYLIKEHNIKPEAIVLTTFTDKASENLKERLKKYLSTEELEKITIGTIHSVCLKILEEFGIEKGVYLKNFRILDGIKQSLFIHKNFEVIGLSDYYDRKQKATGISHMLKAYSFLIENGCIVEDFIKNESEILDAELHIGAKTLNKYREIMKENSAIDFSSILYSTYKMLQEHQDILEKVRTRFEYIIIDEYQDTNPLQDSILRMLAFPMNNFVVIGDDDQSIYRFRNASVENFINLKDRIENLTINYLSENRRSTKEIVDFSRKIANKIPKEKRLEKKIYTSNPSGEMVQIAKFETEEIEAIKICETIINLKKKGIIKAFSEVAILSYSLSSIYPVIKNIFDENNIPLLAKGDKSFSEQDSIQQCLKIMLFLTKKNLSDYPRFDFLARPIFNFNDDNSYLEASEISTDNLDNISNPKDINITSPYDAEKLCNLIKLRNAISSNNSRYDDGLVSLLHKVLEIGETLKFMELRNTEEHANEVLHSIGLLSQLIADYVLETKKSGLSDFNDFFKRFIEDSIDKPNVDEDKDAVYIMTMHQSKGLEYPVVFLPSLVDRRFPSSERSEYDVSVLEKCFEFKPRENSSENRDIDFRRLLYVASTRAEKKLYLSYFEKSKVKAKPSRYITELIEDGMTVSTDFSIKDETDSKGIKRHPKKLKISSSHLQYFVYCPTRYKFALDARITAPQRGYFTFGSSLHNAIEELSNIVRTKGLASLDNLNLEDLLNKHWSDYGFDKKGASTIQKEHALNYLRSFTNHNKKLISDITETEKKFTIEEPNYIITGKIDAIVSSEESLSVIDWKTGKKNKFQEEPESIFVEQQANIYVEAMERLGTREVDNFKLHFLGERQDLENESIMQIRVDLDSRKRTLKLLDETVYRINHRDFTPVSENERIKKCQHCEFRELCPYKLKTEKIAA